MMTVAALIFCLALSFFFSGMETGVLLINRARVRHLKERGSLGAGILLNFLHRPGHLSSTVLVGNILANTAATILVAAWFVARNQSAAAIAAMALLSLVLWLFGDMVPKALFQRFPNRLTTRLAPLLQLAYIGLWPLVELFHAISQALIRALGGRTSPRQMFVTREELKLLAREGAQGVSLTGEQRNLVASILDTSNACAKDVMRSRSEVVTVQPDQTDAQRRAVAVQKGFSRLPIDPAHPEQNHWEGLWVAYDSLFELETDGRNPPRISMAMPLQEALVVLRKAKTPFAIVKDRDGKDAGIITIEDILRRYLGKIEL